VLLLQLEERWRIARASEQAAQKRKVGTFARRDRITVEHTDT
jgi:hypothetical protein